MKVLVLGATGQTGFHVVNQFLDNNIQVKAIVRNAKKFDDIQSDINLEIYVESILEVEDKFLKELLADVDVVISCLGHNISLRGMFGKPHYLVTDAINKIVINSNDKNPKKIILMNTTACLNTKQKEKFTFGESLVMGIMRSLLPPQRDNDRALKYLEENIGEDNVLEWIAVRPDTLIAHDQVTEYEIFASPQRSPIFNAGKTSRINVAHFFMKLISNEELWNEWKYKTPVIYNKEI